MSPKNESSVIYGAVEIEIINRSNEPQVVRDLRLTVHRGHRWRLVRWLRQYRKTLDLEISEGEEIEGEVIEQHGLLKKVVRFHPQVEPYTPKRLTEPAILQMACSRVWPTRMSIPVANRDTEPRRAFSNRSGWFTLSE